MSEEDENLAAPAAAPPAGKSKVLPLLLVINTLLLTGVMIALYGGYATPSETAGLGAVLALILIAVLGKGVDKIIIALVCVQWAYYARTARSASGSRLHSR